MHFLDDALLPENQQKLVIQVAPYGPQWVPGDSSDIPVTMDDQIQKAVDCYNAGATVLHLHCREADGSGSKRLSMFNEMIDRIRSACPDMLIQVGGSISFAPEGEGGEATGEEVEGFGHSSSWGWVRTGNRRVGGASSRGRRSRRRGSRPGG